MRGILAQEHGVDWRKVTWVLNDEEHVAEYNDLTPPNVVREVGADLPGILVGVPDRHIVWGLTYRFLDVLLAAVGQPLPNRWAGLD